MPPVTRVAIAKICAHGFRFFPLAIAFIVVLPVTKIGGLMETDLEVTPAPASTDVAAWRQAVEDGRYRQFRCEDIIAAIQDLGPATDKAVLNPLAKHVSDCMLHLLRGKVGRNHPNRGDNIIEEAHSRLWVALLDPSSADSRGLREAFAPRVIFRMKDVLREEARRRVQALPDGDVEAADESEGNSTATFADSELALQQVEVNEILEMIPDWRKRLAFSLHMDGVPCKSIRGASIAKALDISEKTARQWIKEIQQLLKTKLGDVS
ncbi:MAG: sigma-70 family RNA polymerase sigma factor [Planctomycetia bacterium]|nr:MAG: sigma-70 family RNA polymerase sigma factor [Planctomycetia bacterium]